MKILVFDNYDSFTYNLVHCVKQLTSSKLDIFRNDQIALEKVADYDKIILSPGPGLPAESGILIDLIKTYASSKSILGVCLGLQAIGEAFGGKLVNLPKVFHGLATPINVVDPTEILFHEIPQRHLAGRYHSWVVDKESLPKCLKITALDDEERIMGARHESFDVRGVQFHPESILTEHGLKMIENWLKK